MILLLFLLLGDAEAAATLEEIRTRFATRPMAESVTALEQLARTAPSTGAGGQAAAWRGALALQTGDLSGAEVWFAVALAGPAGTNGHRLGARGMGDLEILRRRYGPARRQFALGAVGATGILAHELAQKQALAKLLEKRQWAEWSCWCVIVACFAYFAARAVRGVGPMRLPTEVVYVLPVYLLLMVGGLGRDPLVLRALLIIGAGSLALIASAGLASGRAPAGARLRWVQAAFLTAGNLALFYAVLNRIGLMDSFMTPSA